MDSNSSNFLRKDLLRIAALVAIAAMCVYILWDIGPQGRQPATEKHYFAPIPEEAPRSEQPLVAFERQPEILTTIRDDQYLERKAFYYLVHQMAALPEQEIANETALDLNWESLTDIEQRENQRGKVVHIKGTIVALRSFKLGRVVDCFAFREDDFKDFGNLVVELRKLDSPVSRYLYQQFAPDTQKMIDSYDALASRPLPEELKKAIVYEFNQVLQDPNFYEEQRFAQLDLADGLRVLAKSSPQQYDLFRLNRRLLEESYPQAIEKTQSAEERGLKDYPVWLACIFSQQRPYLVVITELPAKIKQYDRVEIWASFLKVWLYENEKGEKQRSFVFVGKNLHFLAPPPAPPANYPAWAISGVLAGCGVLLVVAIIHERRERKRFWQRRSKRQTT